MPERERQDRPQILHAQPDPSLARIANDLREIRRTHHLMLELAFIMAEHVLAQGQQIPDELGAAIKAMTAKLKASSDKLEAAQDATPPT